MNTCMQVIVSHQNVDFDGVASMVAAKKLYPEAIIAISDKLDRSVTTYMSIYKDLFSFSTYESVEWKHVSSLILVDVQAIDRTGIPSEELMDEIETIVYDHHPPFLLHTKEKVRHQIEQVGAAITLLIEHLEHRDVHLTPEEVNLFGLGLYSDTGNFTFPSTTSRDFHAASFLMKHHLDIEIVNRFVTPALTEAEQALFNQLFHSQTLHQLDGLQIVVSCHEQDRFQNGLSSLTEKLLDASSADAVITIVKMGKHVHLVCRASSTRINFQSFIKELGGGGHSQAASAMMKKSTLEEARRKVLPLIDLIVKHTVSAKEVMSYPVKTIHENDTITDAKEMMIRFGHTGFPVVNDHKELVGIISRRDVDKAIHHQYGHAPIKGYMTREIVTKQVDSTIDEVQQAMISHNVGRIPIMDDQNIAGIISRTNIISYLQRKEQEASLPNLVQRLEDTVSKEHFHLLKLIGKEADRFGVSAYLVGGFVRDLLLERPNEDLDVVIEGDGIKFANVLAASHGGSIKQHDTFGTATWTTPDDMKIDIVTCRTEYYAETAALPIVRSSNIHEDLTRRDFTINAMAMSISEHSFGKLLDEYQGIEDLKAKKIRILHPISFIEDPTRIFRAVRFAVRFGYSIEKETARLAQSAMSHLFSLSQQRLRQELTLIHKEATDLEAYYLLDTLNVWKTLFQKELPASSWQYAERVFSQSGHTVFHMLTALASPLSNWREMIQLYIMTAKERVFIEQLNELKQAPIEEVKSIGELHRYLYAVHDETLRFYLLDPTQEFHTHLDDYFKKRQEMSLYLSGDDLIKLDFKPGPHFRDYLFELEIKQLNGEISSKEEATRWVLEEKQKAEANHL